MAMAKFVVLFRVDGGHIPGVSFGHLFRCLGLAEDFRRHHVGSVFFMKGYYEGIELVKTKGFHVITLPPETTPAEDCSATASMVERHCVSGVIFDIPAIHQTYIQSLPEHIYTIIIDDTGDKNIRPNVIVNGSIAPAFHSYPMFPQTDYLLGGQYSILGQHFDDLPTRKIRENVETVSVFLGGSDPTNLTTKVIQSLTQFSWSCAFQIIVGPGYKNIATLSHQIETSSNKMSLLQYVENMAQCFLNSDIVITAGGMTLYELAATGTPGISIPSIEHEVHTAEAFQKFVTVRNLGIWTESHAEILPKVLHTLMKNYELRKHMSQAGQLLIDGKGRQQVVTRIFQNLLSMNPKHFVEL